MKENCSHEIVKIKFDFDRGPIWKDQYDIVAGEWSTGIAAIDNDKVLRVLNAEAEKEYTALYSFDKDGTLSFDRESFEAKKDRLLSLVQTIILRINVLGNGSIEVIDEASAELSQPWEWDPDYTKLTPEEKESLEKSDLEMKNGIYVSEEEFWS